MKPLGKKSYGSIPHLIGSKLGPGDHHCHDGQHRIATEKTRDKYDSVVVQEKYDGSNVAVCKINGQILSLVRRGYAADSSPFKQHHVFANWVRANEAMFNSVLHNGDRLCGEWIFQAHGLIYDIQHPFAPFVAFDYFAKDERVVYSDFVAKVRGFDILTPRVIFSGGAFPIQSALPTLNAQHDHPVKVVGENPEGLIYRVERKGKVDFLAKYVRADFEPGAYFPEVSGNGEVFNVPESIFT